MLLLALARAQLYNLVFVRSHSNPRLDVEGGRTGVNWSVTSSERLTVGRLLGSHLLFGFELTGYGAHLLFILVQFNDNIVVWIRVYRINRPFKWFVVLLLVMGHSLLTVLQKSSLNKFACWSLLSSTNGWNTGVVFFFFFFFQLTFINWVRVKVYLWLMWLGGRYGEESVSLLTPKSYRP